MNTHKPTPGPGEVRLRNALNRFGRGRRRRPPLNLQPETPFEAIILERINQLYDDVQALQDQQKWILRLIAGFLVTALLNLVLK